MIMYVYARKLGGGGKGPEEPQPRCSLARRLRPCNQFYQLKQLRSISSSRSVIPNRMIKVRLLWLRPHQNISKRVASASFLSETCHVRATWTKGFTSPVHIVHVHEGLLLSFIWDLCLLHLFVHIDIYIYPCILLSYLTSFLVCDPIQAIQFDLKQSDPSYLYCKSTSTLHVCIYLSLFGYFQK